MDKPTLLIADADEDYRRDLTLALRDGFDLFGCDSGKTALELLRTRQPDYLIMDLLLPEVDGLSLLQSASVLPHPPKVLLVTRMYTEFVLNSVEELGIQYIIQKPCAIAKVTARFLDIHNARSRSVDAVCREVLLELSFDSEQKSGRTAFEAIPILMENPGISLRGGLYPALGPNSERNLRYGIEHAWDNGSQDLWQTYFPGQTKRPSNRDFLRCMVREVNRRLCGQ